MPEIRLSKRSVKRYFIWLENPDSEFFETEISVKLQLPKIKITRVPRIEASKSAADAVRSDQSEV